jgi:hypothetical protein
VPKTSVPPGGGRGWVSCACPEGDESASGSANTGCLILSFDLANGQPISVAPECELLLRVLRRDLKPEATREFKDPRAAVDWERFYHQLDRHGVTSLAYANLRRIEAGIVPPAILSRLHQAYLDSSRRNLFLVSRLVRLLDLFQSADIPVIPLKGLVLAEALYGDVALRQFDDLDLLVRKKDISRAVQLLQAHGYTLNSALSWAPMETLVDSNCELAFRRECGTKVDLHWEIAPRDSPFWFDSDILWSSLRSVRIAGRVVQSPSSECLLVFLCMHGAGHLWFRLQWVCDVARLIEISPEMNWSRVFELAGLDGGEHVVLLGLLVAHDLLHAPLPAEILKRASEDSVIQPLAAQVRRRLSEPTLAAPESWEIATFNATMAERAWDKMRLFAALLKAPTEADVRLLRLPRKLFFLYYPFRIWRLSAKYGARLTRRHVLPVFGS